MKCKKRIYIILFACVLAFGIFTWRYTRNGVHERIGTSDMFYYKHGLVEKDRNGLVYSNGDWWYLKDGKVDFDFVGLVKYKSGIWRVEQGTVNFAFRGFARDENGWWYLRDGKVQTKMNGLVYGEILTDLSGGFSGDLLPGVLAFYSGKNAPTEGWWYVDGGKVTSADTLLKINKRWWCVRDGRVNFSYKGIAENENGKFFVTHGRVYFGKTGTYTQDGCTYILESGKVKGEIFADSAKFVAHRGLSFEAPENTVKAFELAGKAGFWGCETDVRLTADNRFVLLHNKTFGRMCGQKLAPGDLTYDEIKQMTLVSGRNLELYQDDPSATKIAFLEEFLEVCMDYDMVPVIDIKERSTEDAGADYERMRHLYETTKSVMGEREVVYLSFDFELLKLMRQILQEENAGNVTLQFLTRDVTEPRISEYQDWQIGLDADYESVGENTIASFKESGIEVNLWTIDDAKVIYDLILQGADYITTNRRFW